MKSDDLDFLAGLMRSRSGVVLRGDGAYLAQSRLAPLARREGAGSVEALVAALREGAEERLLEAAVEAMAVADTAFFRDRGVFEILRDDILPTMAATRPDGALYVWSAGCSTGQEAYSLAMLADPAERMTGGLKLDIVATDLSKRALEKAHSGLYTQFEVQRGLPIRLLLKHFEKSDDMWRVGERLRRTIRWRRLNLLEDRRSVRPFDVILCRNVIGYFDPETRARVLEQMASALAPDGYLILGSGETAATPSLAAEDAALRIYRPSRAAGLAAA